MGLRPLTDPIPLVYIDSIPVGRLSFGDYVWYPNCGLIGTDGPLYIRITLDGIAQPVNSYYIGGTLAWNPVNSKWYEVGDTYIYERERLGFNAVATFFQNHYKLSGGMALLGDRNIRANGSSVQYSKNLISDWKSEYVGLPGDFRSIGPGRSQGEVFLSGNAGDGILVGVFYDYEHKKVISPVYTVLPPVFGAGVSSYLIYCSDFGILIEIGVMYIRLWSLEFAPVSLSAPVLIAGEEKGGCIAVYETQLLGAQNEPVSEEVIDWSVSGVGTLIDAESMTDDSGYAKARVMYGFGDVGNSTVTVDLVD